MNKPQPQLLSLWRAALVPAAFLPAFLISVILPVGSAPWITATGCLALLFLGAYLFYFPILYRRMSYSLKNGKIIVTTGVFSNRGIAVPLGAIQYVTVSQSIWGRALGLSNVIVTAAGGRLVIPGLKAGDAKELAEALKG